MPITAITGTSPTQPKAAGTTDPLLDKNAFLKLLTAQLRYQDPMSPTDSSTFTSQMSQLSSMEQMTNLAGDQRKLLAATNNSSAVSLLGRTAFYTAPDGSTASGVVTDVDISGTSPSLTIGAASGIDPATLLSVR